MTQNIQKPDAIFEVSWEVCNKVGGIHTVVSTKAYNLISEYNDNLIMIGPDVLRDHEQHLEFIEDENLFKLWRDKATKDGLRVRIGRWNVPGNPLTILVDFTNFFENKDEIFSNFWERYKLDSISGEWDYVEPALFGYSAGKVIESFSRYHYNINSKIVAQFHEGKIGAGILYLKDNTPNIATVLTSHSTIIGESLAENNYPLYSEIENYNADELAQQLNVVSKHSLEKISALQVDSFTTVSDITSKECSIFLQNDVDKVTPNGFGAGFIPVKEEFEKTRNIARDKMLKIGEVVTGQSFSKDTFIVGNTGCYEFNNKGINLFVEALGKINNDSKLKKDLLAFILVPADHYEPQQELINKLNDNNIEFEAFSPFLTHNLHNIEADSIMLGIKEAGLKNVKTDRVKIIFVPAYLDGKDGVFNLSYFNLLIGLDLAVFPSYYEPWGNTVMESMAFSIPTITTTKTGFGQWINQKSKNIKDGITIINRTDNNADKVVNEIADIIVRFTKKSKEEITEARQNAHDLSKRAQWDNLISNYFEAYNIALKKVEGRTHLFENEKPIDINEGRIKPNNYEQPIWHKVIVQSSVPEQFTGLIELSKNLWWSWNYEAKNLFEFIDFELWKKSNYNPIVLLEIVPFDRFEELRNDSEFVALFEKVYKMFRDYMNEPFVESDKSIAYFSMEYGFHDSIKIFSGGLGILAGDYLKQASDSNVNMVAVGLLYRMGYFKQIISLNGEQLVDYQRQQFSHLPMQPVLDENGNSRKISVFLPGRAVQAKIWQVNVGRIKLFLLDTDIEENRDDDRMITHQLYGGDNENRLRQEMILGVGGIRALDQMGLMPKLYHCNEGHAAFIGLERLRRFIDVKNFTFADGVEVVRASTLFTTHTPVPAGHDSFNENLVRTYMGHYPDRLKISWDEFLSLGKLDIHNKSENFSMSHLAVNLSQEVNGVSWLHGEVSKDMLAPMFPGYYPEELHISYVTNGVHYPSWTAPAWQKLYNKTFGKDFIHKQSDVATWEKIYNVEDKEIWDIKQAQKKILISYLKRRVEANWIRRHENPQKMIEVKNILSEDFLIIGFARRFATYKRAYLLFSDLKRLEKIVNNTDKPVLFLFAGKAHPNDKPGQDMIKMIVEISKKPEFLGKILFLENYDIHLAKKLVQGVDIWLNTPTRPLEASGTSGMKAVMNGGLHFSVLDGWWVEGYEEKAGWALPLDKTYDNQDLQNQLDSETIYNIIENDVVPLFYDRDKDNIPTGWVGYVKNSIAHVAPKFTMQRMIDDYQNRFYQKQYVRSEVIREDNYKLAHEIALWKRKVYRAWNQIEVLETKVPAFSTKELKMGEEYAGSVVVRLGEMDEKDLRIELVFANVDEKEKTKISKLQEFKLVKKEGNLAFYEIKFKPLTPGRCNYGIRMYPYCDCLPHKQDFCYVRWV